jgi:hypothetical protein
MDSTALGPILSSNLLVAAWSSMLLRMEQCGKATDIQIKVPRQCHERGSQRLSGGCPSSLDLRVEMQGQLCKSQHQLERSAKVGSGGDSAKLPKALLPLLADKRGRAATRFSKGKTLAGY